MLKNLQSKFLLLLAMILVGAINVWADDVVAYTFSIVRPSSGAVTDYTKTGDMTIDGIVWNVPGNWYQTGALRIGGKGLDGVDRTITGKNVISDAITKITVNHAGVTSEKLVLNSVTVIVASDADFNNVIESKIVTNPTVAKNAEGSFDITPTTSPWPANSYYKIKFNVTNSNTSNYAFVVNSIVFYKAAEEVSPLSSITVDASNATTKFHVGDAFTHDNVVVTATYEDESTKVVTDDATFSGYNMNTTGSQTVTVSYTEGEITKTATYGIQVNPLPNLSSITLSGDYPTVFDQYGTFSYEGLVVTANYDDNTSKEVTGFTVSEPDLTEPGEKNVNVSYTEGEITKSAFYSITVNEYVQPTEVTIGLTNSFFGQEPYTSSNKSTEQMTFQGTKDNVTILYYVPANSNYYFNTSNTRPYNTCTLTFKAPQNYNIVSILFTSDGSNWKTATCSVGKMNDTNSKLWEGSASEVMFSWEETGTRIKTVKVTLAEVTPLSSIIVDASNATTTFHVGDAFTSEGVVVTATYEDESTKVVTDDATFSGYNMNTTGSQTVTVSYTEDEVTKTTSYNIEILAIPELESISVDVTNATTKFYVGDAFTSEGVVVTATYNDQSTKNVTANATFSNPDMTTAGTKTVTVSYTEGEVEKTTSYNIDIPELVSISVDATNATTVFNQNGTFSYEGLVVTAHYNDNSSKDVTGFNVPAPSLTTTGQKTVTVNYTEGEITKSAEYTITVNEYTQPTSVTINLNNTLFGIETLGNNATEQSTKVDGVTITTGCTSSASSKTYYASNHIRFYDSSYLILDAPSGYVITKVKLNRYADDTWNGNKVTPTVGAFEAAESTTNPLVWNGSVSSIRFNYSGQCRTSSVEITLAKDVPANVTANIAAACTDGTLCYSTFSCSSAFVVPEDVIVAEIGIEDGKLDVRAYATGDIVPANTGVMISSATAGEKEFTLSTEDGTSVLGDDNALRATGDEGITSDAMATANPNSMYYRLTMHNGTQIGFWWGAPEGAAFSVAANKAYLVVPAAQAARMENFWFADGIITAINSVNVEKGTLNSDAPMYNLAGQRVSKSYKGVVIQNGKKYIVK